MQENNQFNVFVRSGLQKKSVECCKGITLEKLKNRIQLVFDNSLQPFIIIFGPKALETDEQLAEANLSEGQQLILMPFKVVEVNTPPLPSIDSNSSLGSSMHSSFHHPVSTTATNSYSNAEVISKFNALQPEELSKYPILRNAKKLLEHCYSKGNQASFSVVLYVFCKALAAYQDATAIFVNIFGGKTGVADLKDRLEVELVPMELESNRSFIDKLEDYIKTSNPDDVISNEILEVINAFDHITLSYY